MRSKAVLKLSVLKRALAIGCLLLPFFLATTILKADPKPSISNINPDSARAGGPAFVLTVNGADFTSNSRVNWNDSARPTTLVSNRQLTASIPASDIATAGIVEI